MRLPNPPLLARLRSTQRRQRFARRNRLLPDRTQHPRGCDERSSCPGPLRDALGARGMKIGLGGLLSGADRTVG